VILQSGRIRTWEIQGVKQKSEEILADEKSDGASDPMAISSEGHLAQYQDFINAVHENREPLVNGIEGRKSLEIVMAIYRSSREGKPIHL